jgi:hypothetical protein
MTGLLRVIRGLIGLLIVLQPFGLVINLLWLLPNPGADNGYEIASLLYRLALLAVSVGLFLGLRRIINRLYLKKHGVPHPTLAQRRWVL